MSHCTGAPRGPKITKEEASAYLVRRAQEEWRVHPSGEGACSWPGGLVLWLTKYFHSNTYVPS